MKATAKPERSLPKRPSFREKARAGVFGDLRLLALSAGIILLCAGSLLLGSKAPPEEVPVSAQETGVTDAGAVQAMQNEATEEGVMRTGSGASTYSPPELENAEADVPGKITREERERLLREMAENIPEGEILFW